MLSLFAFVFFFFSYTEVFGKEDCTDFLTSSPEMETSSTSLLSERRLCLC